MTLLVTGSAGFIGSAFVSKILATLDDVNIIGVDNLNDYYDVSLKKKRLEKNMLQAENSSCSYTFVKADIADYDAMAKIFSAYKPDNVVNLAAQAGVRYSIENPDAYIKSNVIGFYNILKLCREFMPAHLVYASSSSVYGENKKIPYSTEDKTATPVSLYAATKASDELLAYSYSKLYDIPSTALRFFTVYGPNGRPDMAYFSFAKKLMNGEKIKIFNNGNCQRDFTYIDDITEGILRVLMSPPKRQKGEDGLPVAPHRVYNIGKGHPEKLLDFVRILADELQKADLLPKNFVLSDYIELVPMQPGDVEITYADTTALERDFNFKAKTDLRQGLHNFVISLKENS